MKILHIIPSMDPKLGGPSQGIRNYEYGLRGKNVERHIVCFDTIDEVNKWSNGTLIIHPLGARRTAWQFNGKLKNWLLNNIFEFDAVIINGLWLYHSYATTSIINSLKGKKIKTPKVFIMPHGMLDPWFQKAKSRKFKALRNEIYWRLIEKNVVNSVDGILFTCNEELKLADQSFKGYNPKNVANVGYGIEEPPTHSIRMDEALFKLFPSFSKKKYLLFLSRIHEKKGIEILIEGYKSLLLENQGKELPDLVIAGPGIESGFGQIIQKKVQNSSILISKVHFVGMLTGDNKWGFIYNCEAFILPSHQENFGIVIAEALACAKPVLISKQVNIWNEIKQSSAGLICDDNSNSVFNILKEYYEMTDEEKGKMSKQARIAFEMFFEVKKTAQQLLDALKN